MKMFALALAMTVASVAAGPEIEKSRTMGNPSAPLRMGSTPGWDSMGHMTVVMELEKEFQTSFPSYRLPELVDVSSIARAVQDSSKK